MRTKIKLLVILLVFASTMISVSKLLAQTTTFTVALISPPRDEIRSGTGVEEVVGGTATSETYLTSFGLNNYFNVSSLPHSLPHYMFDVYCDPANGTLLDINVDCPNCTPANAVGYRIGGNYVLWHNGNTSNIFVGVGAGNTTAYNSCTFVGNNAGNANAVINNTALGYDAMMHNTFGARNTAIGLNALYTQSWAHGDTLYLSDNTAIGYGTLYSNQPRDTLDGNKNVALGVYALYANTFGSENMAIGYKG